MPDGLQKIEGTPLREASDQILGLTRIGGREREGTGLAPLPPLWALQDQTPQGGPEGQPERGILEEGVDAFINSLGPQNIRLLGAGMRALGTTLQTEWMHGTGYRVERFGEELDIGAPPTMPPVEDLETLGRWVSGGLGQGLGSIGVPIAAGGLGFAAGTLASGGNPGVGAVAGVASAFTANDLLLAGEAVTQFEASGVDPLVAAQAAHAIAPAMAALDTLGLVKVLRGGTRKATDSFLKYVARRIAQGAPIESITEMSQSVIREVTDAQLSGVDKPGQRAWNVIEDGIIAAMVGGVVGGGAGAATSRRRAPAKPAATPKKAAPAKKPAAAEGLEPVEPERDAQDLGELPPERPAEPAETRAEVAADAATRLGDEDTRRSDFTTRMSKMAADWKARASTDPDEIEAYWKERKRLQSEEAERAADFDRETDVENALARQQSAAEAKRTDKTAAAARKKIDEGPAPDGYFDETGALVVTITKDPIRGEGEGSGAIPKKTTAEQIDEAKELARRLEETNVATKADHDAFGEKLKAVERGEVSIQDIVKTKAFAADVEETAGVEADTGTWKPPEKAAPPAEPAPAPKKAAPKKAVAPPVADVETTAGVEADTGTWTPPKKAKPAPEKAKPAPAGLRPIPPVETDVPPAPDLSDTPATPAPASFRPIEPPPKKAPAAPKSKTAPKPVEGLAPIEGVAADIPPAPGPIEPPALKTGLAPIEAVKTNIPPPPDLSDTPPTPRAGATIERLDIDIPSPPRPRVDGRREPEGLRPIPPVRTTDIPDSPDFSDTSTPAAPRRPIPPVETDVPPAPDLSDTPPTPRDRGPIEPVVVDVPPKHGHPPEPTPAEITAEAEKAATSPDSRSSQRKSEVDQSIRDRVLADADLFGNRTDTEALLSKGLDSLDRDRQAVVVSKVVSALDDHEVARAVVESIPVDVVNVLPGPKLSADDLLHDPSVLAERLAVPRDKPIPKPVIRVVDEVAAAVKRAPAHPVTEKEGLSDVTGLPKEGQAAIGAGPQRGLDAEPTTVGPSSGAGRRGSDRARPGLVSPSGERLTAGDTGELKEGHVEITVAGQTDAVDVNPTEAQKKAGSYKKGHVRVQGLDITVENPKGSIRSGEAPDGAQWSVTMPAHYGYVRGTEGADADQIDVYLGDEPAGTDVWVVDQVDADTAAFDEHKAFIGFTDEDAVVTTYDAAFDDGRGPDRRGDITKMTIEDFKAWLDDGDTKAPIAKIAPTAPQGAVTEAAPAAEVSITPETGSVAPARAAAEEPAVEAQPSAIAPAEGAAVAPEWREFSDGSAQREEWDDAGRLVEITRAADGTMRRVTQLPGTEPWTDVGDGFAIREEPREDGGVDRSILTPDGDVATLHGREKDGSPIMSVEFTGLPTPEFMSRAERLIVKHFGRRLDDQGAADTRLGIAKAATAELQEAAPKAEEPERPKGYGDTNRVFTKDAAERARDLIRRKAASQVASGIDPELLQAGITLAGYHVEAGARSFAAFSKAMVDDLGDFAKPFLRSWYEGVRHYPEFDAAEMTVGEEIDRLQKEEADAAERGRDVGDPDRPLGGERPGPVEVAPPDEGTAGVPGDPEDGRPGGAPVGAGERADRPGGANTGARPGDRDAAGVSGVEPDTGGPEPDRPPAGRVEPANIRLAHGADPVKEGRRPLEKARDNLRAIEILNRLRTEGAPLTGAARVATPEEQAALALYSGWGGIKGAFPDGRGKFGKGFEDIGRRLRDMLTPQEYERAERSIQYAHYTSEPVIRHMWALAERLGFRGGSILEPGAGIGHFAGFMPDAVAESPLTSYLGIEMDPTSASIAAALYPKYAIRAADYAKRPMRADHFDFAIGNPPFGNIPIGDDPAYAKHKFLIHDFFFAKTLDALKPGGIMMFVTSAGTMNKQNAKAREYLADRADFVGAVRLPGGRHGAFAKNANTEVTTDIIVLRKRVPGDPPGDRSWTETVNAEFAGKDGDRQKIAVNKWFRQNRAMILGEEGMYDTMMPNRYGVIAPAGEDLAPKLARTLRRFPENIHAPVEPATLEGDVEALEQADKDGTYYLKGGKLYQVDGGFGVEVLRRGKGTAGRKSLVRSDIELVTELIPIRDTLRDIMVANVARDDAIGDKARKRLNRLYDAFVKTHGPLNKVDIRYSRPSIIQQETAREEAREEARLQGIPWDEGSFQPPMSFYNETATNRAKKRDAARKNAGPEFDEGSFDPAEMPNIEARKYPNLDAIKDDPEYFRLAAIEESDGDLVVGKGPVFRENIISTVAKAEIASAKDAMLAAMARVGHFDMAETARLYGKSVVETAAELADDVYEIPSLPGRWTSAEEYLSGDVKTKIEFAREMAAEESRFQRNVDALEAVIPRDLVPAEIAFSVGAAWIPAETKKGFARYLGVETPTVVYSESQGKTRVEGYANYATNAKWGTDRVNAVALLSSVINMEPPPKVYDSVYEDGRERRVLNKKATVEAATAHEAIQTEWGEWFEAPTQEDMRADATAIFNDRFRRIAPRVFSGDHIQTPGVRSGWSWRPFQKNVIARIVQAGNTYMAHAVGAGKTSAMIGSAMELKRLGLISKPMFVVPRAMLRQFAVEFQQQYPAANITVADEKNFDGDNRRKFVAAVGLDNKLDGIILTHSAFRKIPLSTEFRETIVAEELADLRTALAEAKEDDSPRYIRNQIQQQIEKMERSLSAAKETDQVFTFEEMGVDQIYVDEAHNFRKLGLKTKQSVKGIATDQSARARDLYEKVRYMRTLHPGRGVVFASGTPVVNTMGEAFNVSRYLQEETLKELGLHRFDNWAATFTRTKAVFEPDPGGGYKYVTRLAEFVNKAELIAVANQVIDYISPEHLARNVARPALAGNQGREVVLAPISPAQAAYKADLAERIQEIEDRRGPPEPGDDIILNVITDGRKMAIDMRLIDPDAENDPTSKLNRMVANVHKIWAESKDQPFHRPDNTTQTYSEKPIATGPATQIIFASLGIKGEFSVIRWTKAELQRLGVPKDEIAFINDYNTSTKRQRLFNDMNEGKVRVLIGHPETLGTGVNVQSRLIASHNLDPLWFPALDEQRVGRIIRQGNLNPRVRVFDYSTEQSFDEQMWSLMQTKGSFIHDFWLDPDAREVGDITMDDFYEQAKALASGDPRILELASLRKDITDLEKKKIRHERKVQGAKLSLAAVRHDITAKNKQIATARAMADAAQDIGGDEFRAVFEWDGQARTEVTTRKDAEALLVKAGGFAKAVAADTGSRIAVTVGQMAGFNMTAKVDQLPGAGQFVVVQLRHPKRPDDMISAPFEGDKTPLGKLEDRLRRIPERLERAVGELAALEEQRTELTALDKGAVGYPGKEALRTKRQAAREIQDAMAAEAQAATEARRAAKASPAETPSRRAVKGARGKLTYERVSQIVARTMRAWDPARTPDVRIVETVADLPPETQRHFEGPAESWAETGAVFDPDVGERGTVYLVADAQQSADEVRRTLAHEIVGHFSMRDMLGDEFAPLLARVYAEKDSAVYRRFAEPIEAAYAGESPDVIAEEIVAFMAEERAATPVMTRAIAAVRRFLRAMGFRLSFTYDEVMGMLARADRRIQTNREVQREADLRAHEPDTFPPSMRDKANAALRELDRGVRARKRPPGRPPLIEATRPIESVFRLLSIPLGGRDAQGNLRISKPMQKAASHVIRDMRPSPDGVFRWLDKPLEIARNGWLNRYGTPKEFVIRERQKFSDAYEIMQELVGFLQGLNEEGVTMDEARALQEVLEGRDLNDERMERMAAPIRERIVQLGQELVDQGNLSEAAYQRNLGKYLHRSYRQYEFEAPALVRWGRKRAAKSRAALRGDEFKARGRRHRVGMGRLLHDVPAKNRKLAAEITTWEVMDRIADSGRVTKRVYVPAGPAGDLLMPDKALQGSGWISQGVWEMRHAKGGPPYLWRDWSEAERTEMGEIRDARYNLIRTYELLANDIATGRFFADIAKNPNWFRQAKPDGVVIDAGDVNRLYTSLAGVEWIRVPDSIIAKSNTKRWGAIAGGYVRAAIWRDINELEKMQNPGTWGWLLREWKANKTARSPTVHFNNTVGNMILSELYDFTFSDVARGLKEFAARGALYEEAVAEGVFNSGFVRSELNRIDVNNVIDRVIKEVEAAEGIERGNMQMVFDLFKRLDRGMKNVYRWEDEVFRLVSFMRDRGRGMLPAEAASNAIDRFLNYDIRAPWPNALRRTVLPFLSYTYAFVPQWLKAMSNKPWKIAKIATLGYALEALSYEIIPGDEDEEERVMADRDRGWTWAGLPKMLRLPFKSGDDPLYVGMTRILPGGGLADTDKGQIGLPEWMMVSGPMLTAGEMLMNRISYTGQDIVDSTDTQMEAAEKRLVYLWRATMPNATWIPGSWNWKMLTGSINGETDFFGREYSPTVAAIRQVGPKLYPYDVPTQRAQRMMEIDREMQEYRRKIWELHMDHNRKRISKWSLDRGMARIETGLKRLEGRANKIAGR